MRRRNTRMKFSVLSSLLLVYLLVMTVQGDSSSPSVVPGYEGDKNKFEVTGVTAMAAQKEPFDQRGGAVHMRKLGLGGKKLTTQEETSMDSKNGKGAYEGGTSKISGKENDGLKKPFGSLEEQENDHQKHMIMGSKAYLKFTKFVKCAKGCNGVPSIKASLESSSRSEEPHQGAAPKDETKSLVDAAKEVANLIYKDYKGRPSHKPPINNHEPRN
ncbi:uncharacterized protein LOC133290203 [Gastrolobium bilobum]|uniref:uncharacterized protein LOC133290203 n=1 Tax=Gastrolobium bilobum TaxID=150636 RepID=UPI002AAF66F7|nr:uncharacterized protein LOC133290203 [Gastrolobium bilobum]